MFLPIGHDKGQVERWPIATLLLMLVCFLVYWEQRIEVREHAQARNEHVREVIEYLAEHPWLRPADELQLGDEALEYLAEIRELTATTEPVELMVRRRQQEELDRRTDALLEVAGQGPLARWGYVPEAPRWSRLFTSLFVHAGLAHLLGNLLFLYIVGPPLEDRWGLPTFVSLYLASGLLATWTHGALDPSPELPLVGASGAIAGLMGAFLFRFRRSKMLFLVGIPPFVGRLALPAWIALTLWFAQELLASRFLLRHPEMTTGVASLAHVGGFVAGLVFAFLVAATGLEKRWLAPRIAASRGELVNTELERIHELLDAGRKVEAFELLRSRLAAPEIDHDSALALWHLAVDSGREDRVVLPLVRFARRALRAPLPSEAMPLVDDLLASDAFDDLPAIERLALAEDLHRVGETGAARTVVDLVQRELDSLPQPVIERTQRVLELLAQPSDPSGTLRSSSSIQG